MNVFRCTQCGTFNKETEYQMQAAEEPHPRKPGISFMIKEQATVTPLRTLRAAGV